MRILLTSLLITLSTSVSFASLISVRCLSKNDNSQVAATLRVDGNKILTAKFGNYTLYKNGKRVPEALVNPYTGEMVKIERMRMLYNPTKLNSGVFTVRLQDYSDWRTFVLSYSPQGANLTTTYQSSDGDGKLHTIHPRNYTCRVTIQK